MHPLRCVNKPKNVIASQCRNTGVAIRSSPKAWKTKGFRMRIATPLFACKNADISHSRAWNVTRFPRVGMFAMTRNRLCLQSEGDAMHPLPFFVPCVFPGIAVKYHKTTDFAPGAALHGWKEAADDDS
jgi:hypothetical protein